MTSIENVPSYLRMRLTNETHFIEYGWFNIVKQEDNIEKSILRTPATLESSIC